MTGRCVAQASSLRVSQRIAGKRFKFNVGVGAAASAPEAAAGRPPLEYRPGVTRSRTVDVTARSLTVTAKAFPGSVTVTVTASQSP